MPSSAGAGTSSARAAKPSSPGADLRAQRADRLLEVGLLHRPLLGLQFSLIDELLETLKRQHYVGVKKSLGMGNMSGVFALTEAGRNLAREYLENNQSVHAL